MTLHVTPDREDRQVADPVLEASHVLAPAAMGIKAVASLFWPAITPLAVPGTVMLPASLSINLPNRNRRKMRKKKKKSKLKMTRKKNTTTLPLRNQFVVRTLHALNSRAVAFRIKIVATPMEASVSPTRGTGRALPMLKPMIDWLSVGSMMSQCHHLGRLPTLTATTTRRKIYSYQSTPPLIDHLFLLLPVIATPIRNQ
jgi:hypothetical protein